MTDHTELVALAHRVVSCVVKRRTGGFTDAERAFAVTALRCLMDVEAPSIPRAV